jgi:hypothetical protein
MSAVINMAISAVSSCLAYRYALHVYNNNNNNNNNNKHHNYHTLSLFHSNLAGYQTSTVITDKALFLYFSAKNFPSVRLVLSNNAFSTQS